MFRKHMWMWWSGVYKRLVIEYVYIYVFMYVCMYLLGCNTTSVSLFGRKNVPLDSYVFSINIPLCPQHCQALNSGSDSSSESVLQSIKFIFDRLNYRCAQDSFFFFYHPFIAYSIFTVFIYFYSSQNKSTVTRTRRLLMRM